MRLYANTTCLLDNCSAPAASRGYCLIHYQHWYRGGGKSAVTKRPHVTEEERFWAKVEKTDTCWLWKTAIGSQRYGSMSVWRDGQKTTLRTHRLSWEYANGPIPDGLFVCHRCDTRACVRPDHLFLGTHHDNMQDMKAKGRGYGWMGTKTHCPQGHEYSLENTYHPPKRKVRLCKRCMNDRRNRYRARKRQERART